METPPTWTIVHIQTAPTRVRSEADEHEFASQEGGCWSARERRDDDPDHHRGEAERGLSGAAVKRRLQEHGDDVGQAGDDGEVEQAEEHAGGEARCC